MAFKFAHALRLTLSRSHFQFRVGDPLRRKNVKNIRTQGPKCSQSELIAPLFDRPTDRPEATALENYRFGHVFFGVSKIYIFNAKPALKVPILVYKNAHFSLGL